MCSDQQDLLWCSCWVSSLWFVSWSNCVCCCLFPFMVFLCCIFTSLVFCALSPLLFLSSLSLLSLLLLLCVCVRARVRMCTVRCGLFCSVEYTGCYFPCLLALIIDVDVVLLIICQVKYCVGIFTLLKLRQLNVFKSSNLSVISYT